MVAAEKVDAMVAAAMGEVAMVAVETAAVMVEGLAMRRAVCLSRL